MFAIEQHTADIRVRVEAGSPGDLFREALAALMHVLGPVVVSRERVAREIAVDAPDLTALLVDFLNEALGLALVHRETYDSVRFEVLGETSLRGTLEGTPASFSEEVKAVTYHEAEVVRRPDGTCSTTLVFDI